MSQFNAGGNRLGRVLALLVLIAAAVGVRRLAYGVRSCPLVGRSCCSGSK
ncbi:MAG: hypothetical protein HY552_06690 [Elusimicrobia bacterium]|nr:hypothetical protein [Elusimicrobiota bacterium]